ncbi:ubiquitin-conjugating enzyme/RWD-like protein [Gorgonomyces haynaldii]|nr:ubiquitin-conjugating enzyme/RWD-like protein [Gorgonomyces haynaldii]
MSNPYSKRILKELQALQSKPPQGVELLEHSMTQCQIRLSGAPDTLYENESFLVDVQFPKQYPLEAPIVVFRTVPVHPHVYSNGHICLSILSTDWSPALTISAVALSLLSMLSSCTKKEKPHDDDRYVRNSPKNPKDTVWDFHDTTV